MEIDSLPVELDEVERRSTQLQIERQALKKEKDVASQERLAHLEKELADLNEQSTQLKARWQQEKEVIVSLSALKERIDDVRNEAERAERASDYERAAQLKYGQLVSMERELKEKDDRLKELQSKGMLLKEEVDEEDIAEVVARWTGIPVSRMLEGEMQKLVHMEERLQQRVVGQEAALRAVSHAIRRARAGLQDPNRPLGSFIFLGPTGVGKTELARTLAGYLFDDERAMIRIDMSEYMEKHSVSRLIGAPPGYVGYDEGGQLTEAVRRRPYSVVLFDEIEKAHSDVFNVLLQLLDDGRLTDGQGRIVDFKNSIIIMTSNLGSHFISELGGQNDREMRNRVMETVRGHFRPEFLNRIDEIIIFKSLSQAQIGKIVDLQLNQVAKRLADRRVELLVTAEAKIKLGELGYDPVYGARPLKRTIQRMLLDPLALLVLEGHLLEKDKLEVAVSAEPGAGESEFGEVSPFVFRRTREGYTSIFKADEYGTVFEA
jgi:ATP-dependent Clp protease ATP-binding subunit ClpB